MGWTNIRFEDIRTLNISIRFDLIRTSNINVPNQHGMNKKLDNLILTNVFIWNFELPIDNMISQTQHIPFVYGFSQEHIWALVVKKLR